MAYKLSLLRAASAGLGALALGGPPAFASTIDTDRQTRTDEVVVQARREAPAAPAASDKTGTPVQDLPASLQTIPREILTEQGATMLRESLYNASGVNVGGQDTKGFYDHFLIRGLNAQIYEDSFSDGDQLGGLSHSLNGVERIEVLEGPGSSLFGSGAPGGTINIIHYAPSPELHYGGSVQGGSFGTVTGSAYVTGASGLPGVDYRVDATAAHSDGFRALKSHDYEIRPTLEWRAATHTLDLSLDLRNVNETPDSYGMIYFKGAPIRGVSIDSKYSTPFDYAHTDFVRPTLSDTWVVSPLLTINNRLSYTYRKLDVLGNGDSTRTHVSAGQVVGRQLRRQTDASQTYDYQLEPVWTFATGAWRHTLLTGFEYQRLALSTARVTGDLPNIPNAFAAVPPETSTNGVAFQCDATHSCDNDRLSAEYYSLYATDQVDVTERLKLRAGVREDGFSTAMTPKLSVPGAVTSDGRPLLAGVTQRRYDAPLSWNVGALYRLTPWASPYVGVASSHLSNFNSEDVQTGIGPPEAALQYEAGIKFAFAQQRVMLTAAGFSVSRHHVATPQTVNGLETVLFDSQRTRGGEASLDARVTGAWRLLANVTVQDAVITDNPQGISSVGHHPQGVPAEIANLWTTYDFAVAGLAGFRIGGGVNYQAKSYSDLTNVNAIPASLVANALIGFKTQRWGLDVNVHNLANQRYFLAANAAGALVGTPLSVSANLHASF